MSDDGGVEFYYNLSTGEVEQGKLSSWTDRMGPYATREEAQHALDRARSRTEAWDAEDAAERAERDGDLDA